LLGLEQDADDARGGDPQSAGGLAAGAIVHQEQSRGLKRQADGLLLARAEAGCQPIDLVRRP
jgi:hypothetical protein